MFFFGHRPIFS